MSFLSKTLERVKPSPTIAITAMAAVLEMNVVSDSSVIKAKYI